MFYRYEIKEVGSEEVLYLYLTMAYEFSKELGVEASDTDIKRRTKNFVKNNKIEFKGHKAFLVIDGIIVKTVDLDTEDYGVEVISDKHNYSDAEFLVTIEMDNHIIIEITLKEYLLGVLATNTTTEMELEALKSLAVLYRTYALKEMQDTISEMLIAHGIRFSIKSRVKSVYSIYKKLEKGKKWSEIYDILALRVITEKESDCYLTIGLIHSKFRPLAKRFKDYIAMPKENMYQSLHTGVFGIDGNIFEVQVRTYEMDEIAEKGMVPHCPKKEKGTKKIQSMMEQKLEIFRNMIETYKETENVEDFAASINSDILGELIYVFTPKGDVVELPKGATPIDFAYRIHSHVGETTIGAIVNDEIVPLSYELQEGDCIKINTNKNSTPSKEWLDFVKTSAAKSKIKAYFSKQDRSDYIENGKNILEKELRKQKLSFQETFTAEKLEKLFKDLKVTDLEEIYLGIGSFRYTANYIIKLTIEEKQNVTDALIEKVRDKSKNIPKLNNKNDIIVGEHNDILVTLAGCCKPVKGDNIIGYITKGEGITVHKADCPNISTKEERLISSAPISSIGEINPFKT